MRTLFKSAVVAAVLAGATVGSVGAASAAGVSFDIGNVALGFSDGYWDNSHHWHRWAHPSDAAHFRAAHGSQYHAWRHDDPKHR